MILGEHLDGTLTESVVIPTINAVRKPDVMSWEEAGSFGLVTVTALRMLERAGSPQGSECWWSAWAEAYRPRP